MHLSYKKIGFKIILEKEVNFSVPVPFLFRSVIGFQLRKMCCIARNAVCADCMFNVSCIYGITFESIVPKDNAAITGRDRISHPIIIDSDIFAGTTANSLLVSIIFLGTSIPYFPYFYHALVKAGEAGIARERVPYQVKDIVEISETGKERSLLMDGQKIDTRIKPERWECRAETGAEAEKNVKVTLLSPLRFKGQDKYVYKPAEAHLAMCLHRRMQLLCSHYGHYHYSGGYKFSGGWTIIQQDLEWRNFVHYSVRQKKPVRLGGLLGSLTLAGTFSPYEYGFLRFAELFHGGKYTNFGLGKMRVEEI